MRKALIASLWLAGCLSAFGWTSANSVSPVDDSKIVQISVDASDPYINRYGQSGRASLVVQCEQNTTLLAVTFPELYMSGNGSLGQATFRVDKKAAVGVPVLASNDHGSIALRGSAAIQQLRAMVGGATLFMRVLPVNENAIDVTFSITGIEQAMAGIRQTCGW